ncbi:hypothetical protein A8B78_11935 [Jannaschia sp. EhC01]|nr:hypothetical protein A8B78_11935 [Jannaschia sp. EhC01]
MDTYIPFCGLPPTPAEVLSRWTLDPTLLIGLVLALAVGWAVANERKRITVGWVMVALLFISPICAASMALFSARVAQHILLTLIAAPLIATALPRLRAPAMPFALGFAILFWLWHAPLPYAATLQSDAVYWVMHISLTGSAVALAASLLNAPERGILALAFTAAELTAFAAILTLSTSAWHGWHAVTTAPYGLSALEDQQLAGALMWVAGGAVMMGLIGWFAMRAVRGGLGKESL